MRPIKAPRAQAVIHGKSYSLRVLRVIECDSETGEPSRVDLMPETGGIEMAKGDQYILAYVGVTKFDIT